MTTIKCLGSSSLGNCYILECNGSIIILELGIGWKEILHGVNYNIGKVAGCLVSHRHTDHAKSVKNALYYGLDVYSCEDVAELYKGVKRVDLGKKYKVGQFYVQAFKTFHNVPNYGYLIESTDGERIVFATDTTEVPYKFKNIHCFLIECNYDEDVIVDNMMENQWNQSHSENHMGIEKCIEFCKNNFSTSLQKIILIHMSNANINPMDAVEKIKNELSFFDVTYAQPNQTYEINKTEF